MSRLWGKRWLKAFALSATVKTMEPTLPSCILRGLRPLPTCHGQNMSWNPLDSSFFSFHVLFVSTVWMPLVRMCPRNIDKQWLDIYIYMLYICYTHIYIYISYAVDRLVFKVGWLLGRFPRTTCFCGLRGRCWWNAGKTYHLGRCMCLIMFVRMDRPQDHKDGFSREMILQCCPTA